MNTFKNILIILKTSKLSYLIDKYGIDAINTSNELKILKDSMNVHLKNCDKFIQNLNKINHNNFNIKVVNDNFLKNETITQIFNDNKFDLIFSLGGDGTFLRSANFLNNSDQVLIGINTDSKNSTGFYCPIHCEHCTVENLTKIIENNFTMRNLNKIEIEINSSGEKYYFMNDLYFGEKFMGRISKYKLEINDTRNEIIKSSGIIFSTFSGYSGWIINANTISFPKFANLIQKSNGKLNNLNLIEKEEIVKKFSKKLHMPQYENENSIFYFVREPNLKKFKENIDEYINYLNFMESSANKISLDNYCYEGVLILDGSFNIPLKYNEKIKIGTSDKKIKTLDKL